MEIIHLEHPHHLLNKNCPETVMALGFFDGVHIGHQDVISKAVKLAKENRLKSAVMTFHPHPSVVLGRMEKHDRYITPPDEKMNEINKLGVDFVYLVRFDKLFASLLPQEFVDEYIIGLNVKHVVAGFDFTYGRLGKGTMETIKFHSRDTFSYTVVDKVHDGKEKISSTAIRTLIQEGQVHKLPNYLNQHYSITGVVIDGDKRGRTIGFPTANIQLEAPFIIPPVGVYAVKVKVKMKWFEGVCNIGYKPTFKEKREEPSIEVHIFNFNEEIYGELIKVEWHKRIRDEKKFSSIDQLVQQINADKRIAEHYFRDQL